jgi:copper(I)-binding protein
MTITNNSSKEIIITSVSSGMAGATEIHQMSETNDIMHMAPVSNLHIPIQGDVKLKPGGLHIMLINLKKPVKEGDIVPIRLQFQDGSFIAVHTEVKKL